MVFPRWTLSEIKEIIMAFLSLCWGILFLFPEDTLGQASRIDLLRVYATDVYWGIFLILSGIFLIFFPRNRYFYVRRWIHMLLWLFWLGMTILVAVRTSGNGLSVSDGLFISMFLTVAFLHAAFYLRLAAV